MIYSLPKYSSAGGKGHFISAQLKLAYVVVACLLFVGITSVSWAKPLSLKLANTAPTATGIASQTVSVFESFSLNVASAFSDAETPNSLTFSQTQLPFDLQINPTTGLISGTARFDRIHKVTVTATDPGGLSVSTQFSLTIDPDTKKELVLTPIANPTQILTTGRSYITLKASGGVVSYQVVGVEGPGTIEIYPFGGAWVSNLPVGVNTFICKIKDATNKVVSAPVNITVTQANRPPVAVTPVADLTVTVGQSFSVNAANLFSDPDGDSLTITVGYLPSNIKFYNDIISGSFTQPGTTKIDLFAYDRSSAGGVRFSIVAVPASTTNLAPFSITGVNLVSCQTVTASERRISFTPQYSGLTGQSISFSVTNELAPTANAGPYSLRVYTDNPTITLKATQAGTAGEASFSYNWLAACSNDTPPTTTFAIAGVNTLRCEVVTAGERRLTFIPEYSGQTSDPVSLSVVNEMQPTTTAGPYTLRVYTDNPTITLVAQQKANQARFSYNWLASCLNGQARLASKMEVPLQVQVLGNPVDDNKVSFEVRGANAQPLQLRLLTPQGNVVSQLQVADPNATQRYDLSLRGQAGSLFLLQVSTPTQSSTVKVLKVN